MKTKQITALLAFGVTFALSVTIASFSNGQIQTSEAEKISQFIAQDVSNGRIRRKYEGDPTATANYVGKSAKLDDSELPADFRAAWRAHLRAWRNQSYFLRNYKYSDADNDAVNLRINHQNSDEISATWWAVLRMARKHDADIPLEAYE